MEIVGLKQSALYNYHSVTKHTVTRLMAPGQSLDWQNEPNPFRQYIDIEQIPLSHNIELSKLTFLDALQFLYADKKIAANINLSNLFFYGIAISAWKQIAGTKNKWALRVNPSSGNLHPTEAHLLLGDSGEFKKGIYHYYVKTHALEKREEENVIGQLCSGLALNHKPAFYTVLTSIFFREAWKYRNRAFRYCLLDLGHAYASLTISAALLGLRIKAMGEFADEEIINFIGLKNTDEKPMLILSLSDAADDDQFDKAKYKKLANFLQSVKVNKLAAEEIRYEAIDRAYNATCLSENDWLARQEKFVELIHRNGHSKNWQQQIADKELNINAQSLVRKRRSAYAMDGQRRMSKEHFITIMTIASLGMQADFMEYAGNQSFIKLYAYVHRVDDLEPGLYYFDKEKLAPVLYLEGDQKQVAKFFSCFQDIAADSCFALSMVADLGRAHSLYGDRAYRYTHFEAGYVGHMLYLVSAALGYDPTGIGCFIDDEINRYLQLPEGQEVIYNFTIGEAVLDPRLTDLSAYEFKDPT